MSSHRRVTSEERNTHEAFAALISRAPSRSDFTHTKAKSNLCIKQVRGKNEPISRFDPGSVFFIINPKRVQFGEVL